ncbi:MAG: DUF3995 domain-containing protein [Chloroflexota bacterium]
MRRLVRAAGILTASVLAVLGLVHLLWAGGLQAGSAVAIPQRGTQPVFVPSRTWTVAVAGGLLAAALTLLARMGIARLPIVTAGCLRWGAWTLAALFGTRAIGEFRYVGLFKRERGTAFARWDTRLYTPLCILIASGSALVAACGSGPIDA